MLCDDSVLISRRVRSPVGDRERLALAVLPYLWWTLAFVTAVLAGALLFRAQDTVARLGALLYCVVLTYIGAGAVRRARDARRSA